MNRIDDNFWLFNQPITHRGLYDNVEIVENTILAFDNSIKHNYAIELDVQMSVDGVLFVFHDDNAKRLTNVNKDVRDLTYKKISSLKLLNTSSNIPTFKEVLEFIDGKTPLVIEMKTQKNEGLEEKIIKELQGYKGEFVLQSFNPLMVRKIQKLEPSIIRGVLTTREVSKLANKIINYMMHHFWFTKIVKCDFINSRVQDLEINKKYTKNYPVICWTVKNSDDLKIAEKYAKNIIFEKTLENLGKFDKKSMQ